MADDPELAAIRAARINQLQQNAGSRTSGPDDEELKQRAANEEQMRRDLLATVLDAGARERLARISLVSPERSKQIEAILFRMAQTGQLRGKVTESQLIDLLEQAEEAHNKKAKGSIVFQRRKDLDDDFDFDL
ncbi:DNA-binding TFAR19-related protein [Thelephora terrestris]|uniref:DNA-binding TFAR19-related protein n=1 Tax=Thelephora terrestris TaxID=56493 RepID=A0A9P6LDR9_9AGAM|nr:DNA-binding TFAR19-related protein [Thelephora terrestris]